MYLRASPVLFLALCLPIVGCLCPITNKPELEVGTAHCPPFSFGVTQEGIEAAERDGRRGISVDLWDYIANQTGCRYRLKLMTFQGMLDSSANGSIDLGLSCATITEGREKVMDFTHGYVTSHQSILLRKKVGAGYKPVILQSITMLVVVIAVILVSAHLFRFLEREHLTEFSQDYPDQLLISVWWSVVTGTTVGYGDVYPRTKGGKLLGMVWIIGGLLVVSVFTANISSSLTASAINEQRNTVTSLSSLSGFQVATEVNTTSVDILKRVPLLYKTYPLAEEAFAAVAKGKDEVKAALYDSPQIEYWMSRPQNHELAKGLELVGRIAPYSLAFTLPKQSLLREKVNQLLLRWSDHDLSDGINSREQYWKKYFGQGHDEQTAPVVVEATLPLYAIGCIIFIVGWSVCLAGYTCFKRRWRRKKEEATAQRDEPSNPLEEEEMVITSVRGTTSTLSPCD